MPTLVDGDRVIVDFDHIARVLVDTYDAADAFGVKSGDPKHLNRLAVANGSMENEVVLILMKRGASRISTASPTFASSSSASFDRTEAELLFE